MILYSKDDFKGMRQAGKIASMTLDYIEQYVQEGISTEALDNLCNDFIIKNGGVSACKGYNDYPKYTCISLNHVVCHGIPSPEKKLKTGDILNIDVTVLYNGYYGDTSRMYYVNKISAGIQRLINITYDCMWSAILGIKPGAMLSDIGRIIESYVKPSGFSIVRDYCGHGIGTSFHEPPNVLHYKNSLSNEKLVPGMIFTIEPMINQGKCHVTVLKDGWTAVTKDKSYSAQYEHTVGITDKGVEVFTMTEQETKFYSDQLDIWL